MQAVFGAACSIVTTVTLALSVEPKFVALYHARSHVYETESHSKKLLFDEISPATNEREKLQIGRENTNMSGSSYAFESNSC